MKKTLFNCLKNPHSQVLALLLVAFALSACIFESDDDGLQNWLADQGMPSSYKVQTLTVSDLTADSVKVFMDTTPLTANLRATFGRVSNLSHDLVMDYAFETPDSSFVAKFKASDTAGAVLRLHWQTDFYNSSRLSKKMAAFEEDVDVTVSWKMDRSNRPDDFLDSIADIEDSVWYEDLSHWKPSGSVDTVYKVKKVKAKRDTTLFLPLPSALVKDLKKMKGATRLQLRISAPEAPREYRFWGSGTDYPPILAVFGDSNETFMPTPFRMASIVKNQEECPECLTLHSGVIDSLVVSLPSEPILKALADFYGDEFPSKDENDVRQTVIQAQLTMPRDDSQGENQMGLPMQVIVGSFVDSTDGVVRRMESYAFDKKAVVKNGHQNLVFHKGDSLNLLLPNGFRDFINKAADGRSMKFIMRLYPYPFLQEKDSVYAIHIDTYRDTSFNEKGDTVYTTRKDTVNKYFDYVDYARYDFSTLVTQPMTLKLWLTSKRRDEE